MARDDTGGHAADGGSVDDGAPAGDGDGAGDGAAADEPADGGDPVESPDARCDYCRLPLPEPGVTATYHGSEYTFCCEHCRDAMAEQDRVFTQWHGAELLRPGVAGFDASLPQGLPRNSFVLLSGQSGTRDEAVLAELAWRRLRAGEPVIVVTFLDSPTSVVQTFIDLGWNVLPYLEAGRLELFDCFTYRLDDRERMAGRFNDWNRHLADVAEGSLTVVEDPTNVSGMLSKLDHCLDAHEMHDRGAVVVDSLTELGSLVQPVKAYDFVKNVRAEVCKARFVPVFAHAAVAVEEPEFPHDLTYMVDGVVDMRFDGETVPGTLLKQLRVRKTNGVLTVPEWHTYEYTAGEGMVLFDPIEEMEDAQEGDDGGDGESEDGDGESEDGDGESEDGDGGTGDDGGDAVGDDSDAAGDAEGADNRVAPDGQPPGVADGREGPTEGDG